MLAPATDDLPSAAQLRAEIDAMPSAQLRDAVRTGVWPLHPLRLRLDAPERLAEARSAVADLDCDHDAELWRDPRMRGRVTALVAERRLALLARAWERLGGGELLFHVRGEPRPDEDRPIHRMHVPRPWVALDGNPGVPPAPCLPHPISLAEAARFAVVRPLLSRAAALGDAAARAFDAVGQASRALHAWALRQTEPPRRRVVWRLRSVARSARTRLLVEMLAVWHVLHDLGGLDEVERAGVPLPSRTFGDWTRLEYAAIGALVWRLARERDTRLRASSLLRVAPAVVGRSYRELDDPFAPLLALQRLGCRLHAFSAEALTLELAP